MLYPSSLLFLKYNQFFCCNQVSEAMTTKFVKVFLKLTVREALKCMHDGQQNCALVVDTDDHLEGIITFGDIKRSLSKNSSGASSSDSSVPDVCLRLCICDLIFVSLTF